MNNHVVWAVTVWSIAALVTVSYVEVQNNEKAITNATSVECSTTEARKARSADEDKVQSKETETK